MKSILKRTTLREIKGSFGRFFAIFAIIALGVGFFSGVRITTPAMVNTVDNFLKDKQLFDYRLVSTLGWEATDVEEFRSLPDVRYAEGSYSYDVLYTDDDENDFVLKTHSILEHVNGLAITDGRMPSASNECVVDADMKNLPELGSKIYVSEDNEDETLNVLTYREFTVVGYANSSYYINFERGSTSIGNGSVSGFVYILPDVFDSDIYTEIFIRFNQDYKIYSDDYKSYMKKHKDTWETAIEEIANERYGRIYDDAMSEIEDAKSELEDAKTEGEQELADAKKELDDAAQEISDNETKLIDAENDLAVAKATLDSSWTELVNAKSTLDASEIELTAGEAELADGYAKLDEAEKALAENETNLTAQEAILIQGEANMQAKLAELEPMMDYLTTDQMAELKQGQAELAASRAQLEAGKAQLEQARVELENNRAALDAAANELAAGRAAYETGKAQYESGLSQYWSGYNQYQNGLKEYEDGKQALADGKEEYEDGLAEYEDGVSEFNQKISDAEAEIADAEQELAELEQPDTYLLERNTNIGYACFESDSEIVAQVARIFPIFFILVAALVCMTTMSRMVEEQRTQIGTFKALGYSEGAIMGKFMFYSGSAALLGCIFGYVLGTILFPAVIWKTYQLMYIPLGMKYLFDIKLAIIAIAVALICSIGTTWFSCHVELSETAAGLMRPKAPKAGKRVLLEYIPFIWKRLKFLHKVSIRNIFRYKRRLFMMVLGISGCTALLMTGFGLNDSVADFAEMQYEEILIADASIVYNNGDGNTLPASLEEAIETSAEDYLLLHEASWDLVTKDVVKSIDLVVPESFDTIDLYMNLHKVNGEALDYPKTDEAYISNSISERYGIKLGDTITLRDENMRELHVTVSGIFENHVYNYVYLSPETMEKQLNENIDYNAAYINIPDDADIHSISAKLMQDENVTTVTLFNELKNRLSKMMNSLNYVVLLVILSAAGLAFIVIYNLTNINITERIREIATIKVLGFFRKETSSYVFRENIVLTALGIAVGLILGVLLHRFVMAQIVVDMVSFRVHIKPISFVYSIVLTFVFNFLVNAVMNVKLDKINMAESLKSVE